MAMASGGSAGRGAERPCSCCSGAAHEAVGTLTPRWGGGGGGRVLDFDPASTRTFSTSRARGATSNSRRSLALVEGEVTLVNTPFSLTMIWNTSGTCRGEIGKGRADQRM